MDALYTLLNAKHIEVLSKLHAGEQPKSVLVNISTNMAQALDLLQTCSEDFEYLKTKEEGILNGSIVVTQEGPIGEQYNSMQD